jgi:hypothetical protein
MATHGEIRRPPAGTLDGRLRGDSHGRRQTWMAGVSRFALTLDLYIIPCLGHERAATVSYARVQRFLAGIPERLSPSTVRKVHATLSAMFTEGIRAGTVRVNPCRHQRLPRVPRAERVIVSVEEAEAIAKTAGLIGGESARVAVRLASYTGVRAGELWALRRRDVDLLHGRIAVVRALKLVGGRHESGPTKTHQERRVSVPRSVLALPSSVTGRPARTRCCSWARTVRRSGTPVRASGVWACGRVSGAGQVRVALPRPAALARLALARAWRADPRREGAAGALLDPDDRGRVRAPAAWRRR